jgi:hypothetical protein
MNKLRLLRNFLYYIIVSVCFLIGIYFMAEGPCFDIILLGLIMCTSALYNITFHKN